MARRILRGSRVVHDDVGPGRSTGGRGRRTLGEDPGVTVAGEGRSERRAGGASGGRWLRARTGPLGVAVALALLAGGVAAVIDGSEPRGGGWRLLTGPEIWLMAVFVTAVLALLFGASAWLGIAFRGRSARDALDAFRARADELDRRKTAGGGDVDGGARPGVHVRPDEGDGRAGTHGPEQEAGTSPAWIMEVGAWLAVLYVAGWIVLG